MRRLLVELRNKLRKVIIWPLIDGVRGLYSRGQILGVPSEDDPLRLTEQRGSLKGYLLNGPDRSELDLTSDESPMREVTW
jgi:hypothetical protein